MLNLDTHVLISFLVGDLNPEEYRFVVREELAISDIVLWELAKSVHRGMALTQVLRDVV